MPEEPATQAPAADPAPGLLAGVVPLLIERVAMFAGDAVRDGLTRLSEGSRKPPGESRPAGASSHAAGLLFAIAAAAAVAAVLAARSERSS